MSGPVALLVAEVDVPILSYMLATLVGTGAAIAVLRSAQIGLTRFAMAPAVILTWASFVVVCATVISLAHQTWFFQQHDLHELGTGQRRTAPMPEAAVAAARARLQPGETWALTSPDGRCAEDSYRYIWLAFRLYPNQPDCLAPQVEVVYGVTPPVEGDVVAAGAGWAVVRP